MHRGPERLGDQHRRTEIASDNTGVNRFSHLLDKAKKRSARPTRVAFAAPLRLLRIVRLAVGLDHHEGETVLVPDD